MSDDWGVIIFQVLFVAFVVALIWEEASAHGIRKYLRKREERLAKEAQLQADKDRWRRENGLIK